MIVKAKKRLDPKLLKRLLALKAELPSEEARSYSDHRDLSESRDAAHRSTEIRWIYHEAYPEIHRALLQIASQHQGLLEVHGAIAIERGVQLSTYQVADHFSWHFDGHPTDSTRRVVSMSILLTDEFEGGKLEFRIPGAPRLKKPGDIVLFNSGDYHRVTPVTSGVRDSLVVWFRTT